MAEPDFVAVCATDKGSRMSVDGYHAVREVTVHDDGDDRFCCGMRNRRVAAGTSGATELNRAAIGGAYGERRSGAALRGGSGTGSRRRLVPAIALT